MHSKQEPHEEISTGFPQDNGASVNTVASLIAEPYFLVIRRAHLPIHPKPARVAAVLWGSLEVRDTGSSTVRPGFALKASFLEEAFC